MMSKAIRPRSIDAIAQRLIATREAFGLSQLEFAIRAGIPGNTYNQYERARSRPSLDFAVRLCEIYGLTLDWIYFGDIRGLRHDLAVSILNELNPDHSRDIAGKGLPHHVLPPSHEK
jgi:transcriptional regulator with XRE-family HTH domain